MVHTNRHRSSRRNQPSIPQLLICTAVYAVCLSMLPPPASPAEPEWLRTGIMPTMAFNEVTEGALLFKTHQPGRYVPAPVLKTDVQITVTGIITCTRVTQEFTNLGTTPKDWLEGLYVFPLPDTAAVDHLRMTVGERTIMGEIKERAEAKRVYNRAKQEGTRASLVEQERPNIFTTPVANIAPGDRITVEIDYQNTVRYDLGTFSLRFPMVVGPRYIPGTPVIVEDQPMGNGWSLDTDRVPNASRVTPPVLPPGHGPINPVSLTVDLVPGFPVGTIESPSHDILTATRPDGRMDKSATRMCCL